MVHNSIVDDLEFRLRRYLHLTTHRHRRCPYCGGKVRREKVNGFMALMILVALRPYRCVDCDKLHYGFCF